MKIPKHFPSVKVLLHYISTDLTTAAYNYGTSQKLGIYVRYKSSLIIKYFEQTTGDLFMAWYRDCIFNEVHFIALGRDNTEKNGKTFVGIPQTSPTQISVLHRILKSSEKYAEKS